MTRFTALIAAGLALAACDPAETVYLEHPDGAPVLCPGGAATQFEFVFPVTDHNDPDKILYEVRDSAAADPDGGPFSTDPDRVSVGLVGGSIESGIVPWIQFTVTCGDEPAPWLVTPQITREDLEKVDDRDFRYVVE